eukprot:CAMPEP_0119261172 /NCGR_PEP_ID=MMETSP1329-20130426/1317_1 /TAXON_ID=114041 /ORGANISM="Genus nov. species nov., Strain RCC1024" /LENGTH=330 /DNA_ID=CAMNT_0007260683 /DNA_START=169 /DNA_END=1161 /DNA_ORIENTATION=-
MGLSRAELGFVLVAAAGSATGLGAAVVFSERLVKLASKQFLAGALGLSAGVMLYVSFVEIMVKSLDSFTSSSYMGESDAYMAATGALFAGMAFMTGLDAVVHWLDPARAGHHSSDPARFVADEVPAPAHAACCSLDEGAWTELERRQKASPDGVGAAGAPAAADALEAATPKKDEKDERLESMGAMTALAIGIHNFPEGLATFVATLDDPAVGASLAVAIAIHNIPEGLCVSIPIYFATGDRWKAFRWALLSGASEPIGALVGWLILKDHFNNLVYGIVFGMVAGMMVMICLNELIPTAHRYDPCDTVVTKSIVAGMAVMAASLCLFVYG